MDLRGSRLRIPRYSLAMEKFQQRRLSGRAVVVRSLGVFQSSVQVTLHSFPAERFYKLPVLLSAGLATRRVGELILSLPYVSKLYGTIYDIALYHIILYSQ